jgi:hypothetical protein
MARTRALRRAERGQIPRTFRPRSVRATVRWATGWACVMVSGFALLLAIGFKALRIDRILFFSTVVYNDLTKSAIDLKVHESNSYFDLSLLVTGALIGLMLAKPDEARITLKDKPELLMFIASGMLLLSSMLCHATYLTGITEACMDARFDRQVTAFNPKSEQDSHWKTETVIGGSSTPVYTIESKLTMEDIRDPGIEYLLKGQTLFVLLGTALSALTILSAKFLKEAPIDGCS